MDNEERAALGSNVLDARLASGMSKEAAARKAGVSSITWKRVEDGLGVQDVSLAAVLRAVGLADQPDVAAPVTLREAADAELLAEIARRFSRAVASQESEHRVQLRDTPTNPPDATSRPTKQGSAQVDPPTRRQAAKLKRAATRQAQIDDVHMEIDHENALIEHEGRSSAPEKRSGLGS